MNNEQANQDDPNLIDTDLEVASGFEVDANPVDGSRKVERLDIEDVVGVDLGDPEPVDADETTVDGAANE